MTDFKTARSGVGAISVDAGKLLNSQAGNTLAASVLPNSVTQKVASVVNSTGLKGSAIRGILKETGLDGIARTLGGQFDPGQLATDVEKMVDPQQTIHWDIQLPDMGWNVPPIYVEDVTLHSKRIDVKEYHRSNSVRRDPGFVSYDSVSLDMYEDIRGSSTTYFHLWRMLVENNGLYGRPADYKRPIVVTLYDSKRIVGVTATIKRAWPVDVQHTPLSGQNDRMRLSVQFANEDIKWRTSGGGINDFLSQLGINIGSVVSTGNAKVDNFVNSAIKGSVSKAFGGPGKIINL